MKSNVVSHRENIPSEYGSLLTGPQPCGQQRSGQLNPPRRVMNLCMRYSKNIDGCRYRCGKDLSTIYLLDSPSSLFR